MKFSLYLGCICLAVMTILFSCGKDGDPGPEGPQGEEGLKSIIDIETINPGTQCANGGILIKSGIDKNRNNILEATEVDQEQPVCNGINGGPDKQVIFKFSTISVGSNGSGSEIGMQLPDFNIADYPGVDSIVLMATVYGYPSASPITTLELYNMTDNEPIAQSAIVSQDRTNMGVLLVSSNARTFFPEKPIKLGLRITAENPSDNAIASNVFMILYRK